MDRLEISPKDALKYAWKGMWEKIPTKELGKEYFDYEGDAGDTLLHAAAHHGKLKEFDLKWLTPSRLGKPSYKDTTVYYYAAVKGCLNQIPKESMPIEELTRKYSDRTSILSTTISNHNLDKFPMELLSPDVLLMDSIDSKLYIHQIADQGDLSKLPKELLTKEVILSKDQMGNNVLFYAARSGDLKYIPRAIMDKASLMQQNAWGETLLHWAASGGRLTQIDKELITGEALLVETKKHMNVFHIAIMSQCLQQLEWEHLSWENLTHENGRIASPLSLLLSAISDGNSEQELLTKKIIRNLKVEQIDHILSTYTHIGEYEKELRKEKFVRRLASRKNNSISLEEIG